MTCEICGKNTMLVYAHLLLEHGCCLDCYAKTKRAVESLEKCVEINNIFPPDADGKKFEVRIDHQPAGRYKTYKGARSAMARKMHNRIVSM